MIGNTDKALDQYQAAQALDSGHEESLLNLAIFYLHVLNSPTKTIGAERFPNTFP